MQPILCVPYLDCILQYFHKYYPSHQKFLIKALELLNLFKPIPSRVLIKNWYFVSHGCLA